MSPEIVPCHDLAEPLASVAIVAALCHGLEAVGGAYASDRADTYLGFVQEIYVVPNLVPARWFAQRSHHLR
jgi:hypothetical protein